MSKMHRLSRYTCIAACAVSEWSSMGSEDASDSRLALLQRWVFDELGFAGASLAPASADASFRRYFRLTRDADSFILMDAPPQHEDLQPFLKVAKLLGELDLQVPAILARHDEQGFLLLSDLGSRQYLDELRAPGAAERLYADALAAVRTMQLADAAYAHTLPHYSHELLMREMRLMPEWFLERHLGLRLQAADNALLEELFETLSREALRQPEGIVHRDYHSRNLLVTEQENPGILDFQDAVRGPVTYDLVSLLKDCYITWPASQVRDWVREHRQQLLAKKFALPGSEADFLRGFDLMGLQRHIKVLGIFARLFYRDGKAQYLSDLPRVLAYVRDTAAAYPETAAFADFIATRIEAAFADAQARTAIPAPAVPASAVAPPATPAPAV